MNEPLPDSLPRREVVRDALEVVAQTGVPGQHAAAILDIGTGPFVRFFGAEILDDLIFRGGATCRFFDGSYGSGKTHLLRLLGEHAVGQGMATVQTELSPDLGLEDWKAITRYILQKLEVRIADDSYCGLPLILEGLRRHGLADAGALRKAGLPHAGFQAAMVHAVTEATVAGQLHRYLLGDRVTATQLKGAGLTDVKDPLSRRNAEQVLNTVVGGLFHLGVPGTLLLFDENEKTLNGSRPKGKIASNLMRRLIDACATGGLMGTAVVFAVLPGFIDHAIEEYQALGQRIEMMREPESAPAWRWPVLPIEAVSTVRDPDEFLRQAVERFSRLVTHCGGDKGGGGKAALLANGRELLAGHPGADYRRPLMKRLAIVAIGQLDGEGGG